MTGYLAAIFFATVFMLLLHPAEWRTASAMAARLHSESNPVAEVRDCAGRSGLTHCTTSGSSLTCTPLQELCQGDFWLLQLYHWGGLTFGEASALFEKWAGAGGAFGRSEIVAISAVAVLDIECCCRTGFLDTQPGAGMPPQACRLCGFRSRSQQARRKIAPARTI
jgi:hypothetical protein